MITPWNALVDPLGSIRKGNRKLRDVACTVARGRSPWHFSAFHQGRTIWTIYNKAHTGWDVHDVQSWKKSKNVIHCHAELDTNNRETSFHMALHHVIHWLEGGRGGVAGDFWLWKYRKLNYWYTEHVVSGTNGHNASLITRSQVGQYGGRHLTARSVASYSYRRKKQLPVNTVSTVHLAWKATIYKRAAKHKIQVLENLTRWINPQGYTSHITYPSVIFCSSGYKVRTTTRSLGHWKIWKVQQNSGPSKSTVATFSFEVSRLFVGRSRLKWLLNAGKCYEAVWEETIKRFKEAVSPGFEKADTGCRLWVRKQWAFYTHVVTLWLLF